MAKLKMTARKGKTSAPSPFGKSGKIPASMDKKTDAKVSKKSSKDKK